MIQLSLLYVFSIPYRHLVLAGGPSVLLLFNDLTKPTLSILRCINTSQDKVVITAGEGSKINKRILSRKTRKEESIKTCLSSW